jgi:hypothetical protein
MNLTGNNMNQHDQINLGFLMSLTDDHSVRAWFATQTPDNIVYALSLLYAAQDITPAEQPITDVSQASALLRQFTL